MLRLRIPPLRARLEDMPALTTHLLRRIDRRRAGHASMTGPWTVLSRHDWPGNVRELYHTLERAWLVGGGRDHRRTAGERPAIGSDDDDSGDPPLGCTATRAALAEGGGFKAAMDFAEKQLLIEALRASGG